MLGRHHVVSVLLALSLGAIWATPVAAQAPAGLVVLEAGGELFRTYCVVCHGAEAKGDGPLAKTLTRKPADLTGLARRNMGTYPTELVYKIIDGRKPVKGHGGGDMPEWADAFSRSREIAGNPEALRNRIEALVRYLETLQVQH